MQLPLFASRPHRSATASASVADCSTQSSTHGHSKQAKHRAAQRLSPPPFSQLPRFASDRRALTAAVLFAIFLFLTASQLRKLRNRLRSAPRSILVRGQQGRAGALTAFLPGATSEAPLPDPAAVTFYDDPVTLVAGASGPPDGNCSDITPPGGGATVFAARDNPSLYHLLRIQLLPIFLALASFELHHGAFQIVFVDGKPRDWATHVFDDAAGLPSRLLGELPECFRVRDAVVGVRYDDFRISAHAPASTRDLATGQPQLTAFAAWLLARFRVSHAPAGPADMAGEDAQAAAGGGGAASKRDGREGISSQTQPAATMAASVLGGNATSCERLRSSSGPQPLLTLVVRTAKRNGQGRRLTGTEHMLAAAEACGFATTQLDMAALPFAEQLQTAANSSVLVTVHGAASTMLLALPPLGVSVELRPYKFDAAALYYHLFGNWAAAAKRTHLVWHQTNPWHSSPGIARVDDYKNADTRMTRHAADGIVAAAAAALAVPPAQRNFDTPVLLNQPMLRCNYSHIPGNLVEAC